MLFNIEWLSWMMLIFVALAGVFTWGIFRVNKQKGKTVAGINKGGVQFVMVILIVGALYLSGLPGVLLGEGFASPLTVAGEQVVVVPGVPSIPATSCGLGAVEDVTVTLSALNAETSVATGGTHRYRVGNAAPKTVSDAGTFTASAGDAIEVLWYNASVSGGYFSDRSTFILPCDKGTFEETQELFQNGTVAIEVFNEEGNLIVAGTESETLTAGDVVTLEAKLKGTYQTGMPYGGVMVVEYNSTEIDDVIVQYGGSEVNVPSTHTIASTDHKAKAYSVPAIISNTILTGSVTIDVDDSVNPANIDNITMQLYPNNYFINEDNGGAFAGPAAEDEDDAVTMTTSLTYELAVD